MIKIARFDDDNLVIGVDAEEEVVASNHILEVFYKQNEGKSICSHDVYDALFPPKRAEVH